MNKIVGTTEAQTSEEKARIAVERKMLYSLLAAVFRSEMSEDILRGLLNPDFLSELMDAGFEIKSLTELKPGVELLEELAEEFSRLFMGPGKHVAPYESVHINGENGNLWGPETSAVKRFIEQSGFDYNENFHGLPDHISVELEFMAHLVSTEAESWQNNDVAEAENSISFQIEFLSQHLSLWTKPFADKVCELAELPVYSQMAMLTHSFVEYEKAELLSSRRGRRARD